MAETAEPLEFKGVPQPRRIAPEPYLKFVKDIDALGKETGSESRKRFLSALSQLLKESRHIQMDTSFL